MNPRWATGAAASVLDIAEKAQFRAVSSASEIKSVACDKRRNVGAEPSALQSGGLVAALPRQGTLTRARVANCFWAMC